MTTTLKVREGQKPEDEVQQWGRSTCWTVSERTGEIPVAAFNSERSALTYCLRAWAKELS